MWLKFRNQIMNIWGCSLKLRFSYNLPNFGIVGELISKFCQSWENHRNKAIWSEYPDKRPCFRGLLSGYSDQNKVFTGFSQLGQLWWGKLRFSYNLPNFGIFGELISKFCQSWENHRNKAIWSEYPDKRPCFRGLLSGYSDQNKVFTGFSQLGQLWWGHFCN